MTPQEYREWLLEEVKAGRKSEAELKLYHVRHEQPLFDSRSGDRLSVPSIQKYGIREWGTRPTEGMQDYYNSLRIRYEILFNPREKADNGQPEEAQPKAEAPATEEGQPEEAQPAKKGKAGKPAKTVNIENE